MQRIYKTKIQIDGISSDWDGLKRNTTEQGTSLVSHRFLDHGILYILVEGKKLDTPSNLYLNVIQKRVNILIAGHGIILK